MSILLDRLEEFLTKQGFYRCDANGKTVAEQQSVVRTNCMDCLDRTNVVQAMIARRFLKLQLIEEGILEGKERIEDHPELENILRNVWADNADAVSITYSGTGALKTDYTRTGKRTRQGALQDGVNSSIRYLKNNFLDGSRQDAFDLFVGNYRVYRDATSPFASTENVESIVRFRLLPMILGLSFFMLLASIFVPAENPTLRFLYMAFWATALFFSSRSILQHGTDFVTKPKLFNPITGKVHPPQ